MKCVASSETLVRGTIIPHSTEDGKPNHDDFTAIHMKGHVFRVRVSTLYKRPIDGGMNMIHVQIYFQNISKIYFTRLTQQYQYMETPTAHWLYFHEHLKETQNPPNWTPLPKTLECLRIYLQEKPYIRDKQDTETFLTYKRYIYNVQRHHHILGSPDVGMQIQNKFPDVNWTSVWRNISKLFCRNKYEQHGLRLFMTSYRRTLASTE
jgi:hypothetical protein